jgi:hypothetical protein
LKGINGEAPQNRYPNPIRALRSGIMRPESVVKRK